MELTEKHNEFLSKIKELGSESFPSLKFLCQSINFDYNLAKAYIASGYLDSYLGYEEVPKETYIPSKKLKSFKGKLPPLSMLEKIVGSEESVDVLKSSLDPQTFGVAYSLLKKENLATLFEEGSKRISIAPQSLDLYLKRQSDLENFQEGREVKDETQLVWLLENGFIEKKKEIDYSLTALESLKTFSPKELVNTLDSSLISSGEWKNVVLKPYQIDDPVPNLSLGSKSFMEEYTHLIRNIFLDMGFNEMEGKIVDSSFWNFDVLFTPQDHPARDIQDTFYLDNPKKLPLPNDQELINQVKLEHQRGYGSNWTEEAASKALLRTHTTASTARKLYELGGKEGKYFSIDKVFRNETVDRVHLPEFHQIEGVVIGDGLNINDLVSHIKYFYERLGFEDIKFKSTFNPYTEPSLEISGMHNGKILEIGNSGMFRQEVLRPLKYGGKSSIAWGLGLERLVMIKKGITHWSEIIGPKIKLADNKN